MADQQQQTVIVEVRADEVRAGDEIATECRGLVPDWVTVSKAGPAGVDSTWDLAFWLTDEDGRYHSTYAANADQDVLVRRPVPSGADALREARETVEGWLRHLRTEDLRAAHEDPNPADHAPAAIYGRVLYMLERLAAPAVASSGAEGDEAVDEPEWPVEIHPRLAPGGPMVWVSPKVWDFDGLALPYVHLEVEPGDDGPVELEVDEAQSLARAIDAAVAASFKHGVRHHRPPATQSPVASASAGAEGEREAPCTCGNGEAEDDRGAVLACPVHGFSEEDERDV